MMSDEEYREYLVALARKHLRPTGMGFGPEGAAEHLRYDIERLSSIARFVRAVGERSENQVLVKACAEELRNTYSGHIIDAMDRSGVLAALDEAPDITFSELRRSAVPQEDVELLRRAGMEDPEAELTIIIQYSRKRLGNQDRMPSEIARQVEEEFKSAAKRVEQLAESKPQVEHPEKKKKKILNGIGKLLAGTVTAAGNLLLAAGTIVAPNPATAYGVIASSAVAVGAMCQGIGDLRGE